MEARRFISVFAVPLFSLGICGCDLNTLVVENPLAEENKPSATGLAMIKLYKKVDGRWHYHEAWAHDGQVTEHWGIVGEDGTTRDHDIPEDQSEEEAVSAALDSACDDGYEEVDLDDHAILIIEFAVDGFGTPEDLEKRYRLQDRMNQTLGWKGLGHCDGGSIGSGTMEVACFVIDFEKAKSIVEQDLMGTEFEDFSRIYNECDMGDPQ